MKIVTTVEDVKKKATKDELELYSYVMDMAETVSNEIVKAVVKSKEDEGGIYFVYGPVNSGKTIVACLLIEKFAKQSSDKVMAVQPEVDRIDVPKDKYYSRAGVTQPVHSIKTKQDLEKMFAKSDIVIIDEMQFLTSDIQSYFLKEAMSFVDRGGWLICLGMLYTSQASEFLLSAVIKDRSVKSYPLTATCQKCGAKNAYLNQRLVNSKPTTLEDPEILPPSAVVSYEPRCSDCHIMLG